LRIGKILEAERIEGSEKLLKLKIKEIPPGTKIC
jgi:tRNA-binding EMAP/Myf-like protein